MKRSTTTSKKTTDTTTTTVSVQKQEVIPIEYKPFPNPTRALYGDFLRWAEKGAYFIMQDTRSNTTRHYHKHCKGEYGTANIPEMIKNSNEEPLIVLNLTHYPDLMHDGEWNTHLTRYFPEYKHCICAISKKILNCQGLRRECYELRGRHYFYLTGLNQEGEDCLRNTKLAAYVP